MGTKKGRDQSRLRTPCNIGFQRPFPGGGISSCTAFSTFRPWEAERKESAGPAGCRDPAKRGPAGSEEKMEAYHETLFIGLGNIHGFLGHLFNPPGPAPAQAEAMTLRMLVWEGYAPAELREQFVRLVKEKHGVDLTIDVAYVNGNDDFFPALRDKKADLISPSHPVPKDERWKLIKLKLTLPIDLANVPNYQNVLPSLQKADYCTVDGKVYAVPHVRGPYGLAYNTALVQTPPDSWNVLWALEYKGKVTTTVRAKLSDDEIARFHLDDPSHFEKNRILWKILKKRDRKGLQKLWTNALKKSGKL